MDGVQSVKVEGDVDKSNISICDNNQQRISNYYHGVKLCDAVWYELRALLAIEKI